MGKAYRHLSLEERTLLQTQLVMGWSPAAIAAGLQRARSTITREMARNGWRATPARRPRGRPRKADAVVGEAVLREVLGADLLAAVAGAHRLLAFADQFGLLLFHLHSYGISCTFITRLAIVSSPFSSI